LLFGWEQYFDEGIKDDWGKVENEKERLRANREEASTRNGRMTGIEKTERERTEELGKAEGRTVDSKDRDTGWIKAD
jgi:hypothetical protein